MAKEAVERRIPLRSIFSALHSVSLRDLITHCLTADSAAMHLAALPMLGSMTAGARQVHRTASNPP